MLANSKNHHFQQEPTINLQRSNKRCLTSLPKYLCCHKVQSTLARFDAKRIQDRCQPQLPKETEVLVIGNGPSGIFLSYLLNGYVPHIDSSINNSLQQKDFTTKSTANKICNLFDSNLEELSKQELGNPNRYKFNPVHNLLDNLINPGGDFDIDEPSKLKFKKVLPKLSHVVLGKSNVGGIWSKFKNNDVKALSHYRHLELPGLSFLEWRSIVYNQQQISTEWRPKRSEVYRYYKYYIRHFNLQNDIFENYEVFQVTPTKDFTGPCNCSNNAKELRFCTRCSNYKFIAKGIVRTATSIKKFTILANQVVLATGNSVSNKLNVQGEFNKLVFDDVDLALKELTFDGTPTMVVGSGLSAADFILKVDTVIHQYYSPNSYPRPNRSKHPLANCWKEDYPEYHSIYSLMKKQITTANYAPIPDSQIVSITDYSDTKLLVKVRLCDGTTIERIVNGVVNLTGYKPSLYPPNFNSYGSDHKNWDSDKLNATNVFKIGAANGNNFVRQLLPNCITTYQSIVKSFFKL